ncbi:hypothetical protein GCM10010402_66270 [Actinomadura luteofluorescens]
MHCKAIAREITRSPSTVSKIARHLSLSFDRAQTRPATAMRIPTPGVAPSRVETTAARFPASDSTPGPPAQRPDRPPRSQQPQPESRTGAVSRSVRAGPTPPAGTGLLGPCRPYVTRTAISRAPTAHAATIAVASLSSR